MYRIKIFVVLCFGISVGVSAIESPDKQHPSTHGHTPPPPVKQPATATEFHKQAEQVKIKPPVVVQQPEQVKIQPPVVVQQPVCNRGQHLEHGRCVAETKTDCSRGEHLKNGRCVAEVVIPSPTIHCPANTHLVHGECVKNTPQLPEPHVEKPKEKSREKPAAPVEANNPSLKKNAEQPRKNVDAPADKPTEHHTEIDKPHKNEGKVQPCNGGFIPVEEECTPSTAVKPVIAADEFAKRMGIAYCKENPEECGVVSMEKFKAARSEGIAYCKKDPLLCDLYSQAQVEAAKKEGIAQCQKFPSLCGLTRTEVVTTPK